MDWLSIGRVGAPQGLRGGFFCVLDDARSEPLACRQVALGQVPPCPQGHTVFDQELQVYEVVRSFVSGGRCVLLLRDVGSREAAQSLLGRRIYVAREEIGLAEDEILVADLVGTTVLDEHGSVLGTIRSVHDFGAQTTLEIGSDNRGSFYFPFLDQFVVSHEPSQRIMVIQHADDFRNGD